MTLVNNVIQIADARPHLAGPAHCIECGHRWQMVAPTGTTVLDCPGCGGRKGARFAMVEKDCAHWVCNCGNRLFFITPEKTYCGNCGMDQVFP